MWVGLVSWELHCTMVWLGCWLGTRGIGICRSFFPAGQIPRRENPFRPNWKYSRSQVGKHRLEYSVCSIQSSLPQYKSSLGYLRNRPCDKDLSASNWFEMWSWERLVAEQGSESRKGRKPMKGLLSTKLALRVNWSWRTLKTSMKHTSELSYSRGEKDGVFIY